MLYFVFLSDHTYCCVFLGGGLFYRGCFFRLSLGAPLLFLAERQALLSLSG